MFLLSCWGLQNSLYILKMALTILLCRFCQYFDTSGLAHCLFEAAVDQLPDLQGTKVKFWLVTCFHGIFSGFSMNGAHAFEERKNVKLIHDFDLNWLFDQTVGRIKIYFEVKHQAFERTRSPRWNLRNKWTFLGNKLLIHAKLDCKTMSASEWDRFRKWI